MGLLELLCSFAFGGAVSVAAALRRESVFSQRSGVGGEAALLLSSIERGAQRFVSQAIRRANNGNLK